MRKIFAFLVTSVDGYYVGANEAFDWPVVDDEFNEFAIEQLDEIGTLLFGRLTYEAMASYWPTSQAQQDDPAVADRMNGHPKVVVSQTLERATWANTRLLSENATEEITRLKQEPDKDIAIFGSSNLTVRLLENGLVDELRIMVHPVVLGAGKSLFHTAKERIGLTLRDVRRFESGSALLYYQPVVR